jgi:hypothetical protein
MAIAAERPRVGSGLPVFAHHVDTHNRLGIGQFVGVVEDAVSSDGQEYLHVRGGLENVRELFLPMSAVRTIVAGQVHLNLSTEDLVGQTWHTPPARLARGSVAVGRA